MRLLDSPLYAVSTSSAKQVCGKGSALPDHQASRMYEGVGFNPSLRTIHYGLKVVRAKLED